ncbi:LPS export ABC transporter permease LptG [Sphingomonas sp. ASV193]|uniref:LPS export ABC transporter permease LptG n=1 Tax=Sphingomonas sp. ASV193 TaxID=3144405 RepID=UPI0032E900E4
MINFDFLPSRQIALYLARLFITRSLAVLVGLALVLMALDLLGESGKILAVKGNGEAQIWQYLSLRLPLLIKFLMPFSVLLGTLIALTGLNSNSEVVAMKAAGMSAHQILAPLVIASLGVAAINFAFNETVAVRAARILDAWNAVDYRAVPPDSGVQADVWLRENEDMIHAAQVIGRGPGLRLAGLTIYDRQGTGLKSIVKAAGATRDGNGWLLRDVATYDVNTLAERRLPTLHALDGVAPDRFTLAKVVPAEQGFGTLGASIDALEKSGRPTEEARTGYWHKLSTPLSIVLMPILAALAAFGLARSGQVLVRAAVGMALGFTFFVVDNVGIALGNAGAYPPFVAAWAPFLLFFLIGETVLIRTEE